MQVTNTTKAVINYKGKAFGPNAVLTLAEGDEKNRGIARMLGDGRLSVQLGGEKAATAKPSDGLKVDEIKAALEAKKIDIPTGVTKRDDLAALLDAA